MSLQHSRGGTAIRDAVLTNWGAEPAPDFRGTGLPEPAAMSVGVVGLFIRRRHGTLRVTRYAAEGGVAGDAQRPGCRGGG